MLRKFSVIFLIIITIVLIFIIQAKIINNMPVFGIVANLILVTIVTVSINYNIYISLAFAAFFGILTDIFFSFAIGKEAIIYLVIAFIIFNLSKFYRKENKYIYLYLVFAATIIFEITLGTLAMISTKEFTDVFSFLMLIIKSSIVNIILIYLVYFLFNKLIKYINKTLSLK